MSHRRELKNAQQRVLNAAVALHRKERYLGMGIGVGYEHAAAVNDVKDARRHFDHAVEAYLPLMTVSDGEAAASARQTSIGSAKMNLSVATSWRGKVQRAVYRAGQTHHNDILGGMTCDELEVALEGSHQSISSAVNYAEEHGWIRDSGLRRNTRSGTPAIVYEYTDAFVEVVRREGTMR